MDIDPREYETIVVDESDVHKIVQSYLMYNCFIDTLDSFFVCIGAKKSVENLDDIKQRKQILQFAIEGDASRAVELTNEYVPGLLDENKDLHFDILSLQFIEFLRSRKIDEALGFAQSKFTPFGKEQKYVKKLEDLMALLAYEEPEKSPIFHLLSPDLRHEVAESLNCAILAHTKHPCYSTLERLIRQTTVATQELYKDGCQAFSMNDFLKDKGGSELLNLCLDVNRYQMNPANYREALIESHQDESRRTDILLVRRAAFYTRLYAFVIKYSCYDLLLGLTPCAR